MLRDWMIWRDDNFEGAAEKARPNGPALCRCLEQIRDHSPKRFKEFFMKIDRRGPIKLRLYDLQPQLESAENGSNRDIISTYLAYVYRLLLWSPERPGRGHRFPRFEGPDAILEYSPDDWVACIGLMETIVKRRGCGQSYGAEEGFPADDRWITTNYLNPRRTAQQIVRCPIMQDAHLELGVQEVLNLEQTVSVSAVAESPAFEAYIENAQISEDDPEELHKTLELRTAMDHVATQIMDQAGANPQVTYAKRRAEGQFRALSDWEIQRVLRDTGKRANIVKISRETANNNIALLDRLTGGSPEELFLAQGPGQREAQIQFMVDVLNINDEEATKAVDDNFQSCMALARALSRRQPETVDLADALRRLGLSGDAWKHPDGIRFNSENVEEGGKPGFPLQVHQVNDAELMRQRFEHHFRGLILANEAGLGKTITYLLAIYSHARRLKKLSRSTEPIRFFPNLVIVPAATITQVLSECLRVFYKKLTPIVYFGTKGDKEKSDPVLQSYQIDNAQFDQLLKN